MEGERVVMKYHRRQRKQLETKTMKPRMVKFNLADSDGAARVLFRFDQQGKPTTILIKGAGANDWLTEIDNSAGNYKPCLTHCYDLVRLHRRKPASSEQARQREKRTKREPKPKLTVVG